MLVAVPSLLNALGCARAKDPSDYDDDDDRPRKKHKKPRQQDGDDDDNAGWSSSSGRSGGERRGAEASYPAANTTWFCAPSDVTACFATPNECRERAKYLPGTPACVAQASVYCYTHDRYLNATYACFATFADCSNDQGVAKAQERQNVGTYYNVSTCQGWGATDRNGGSRGRGTPDRGDDRD